MKDVTHLFNNYRECVRNLWNIHFLKHLSVVSNAWDFFDEYDDICSMLFVSLVLNQVHRETFKKASAYASAPEPLFFFASFHPLKLVCP